MDQANQLAPAAPRVLRFKNGAARILHPAQRALLDEYAADLPEPEKPPE
jgi:hypothetical protein